MSHGVSQRQNSIGFGDKKRQCFFLGKDQKRGMKIDEKFEIFLDDIFLIKRGDTIFTGSNAAFQQDSYLPNGCSLTHPWDFCCFSSSSSSSSAKGFGHPGQGQFDEHLGHLEGEQPYLGGLLRMVFNHILTGMILQVGGQYVMEYRGSTGTDGICSSWA